MKEYTNKNFIMSKEEEHLFKKSNNFQLTKISINISQLKRL